MNTSPFCAAVDWGTSSFRVWLLAADGTVLAARRSGEGLLSVEAGGFAGVLEQHLAALQASDDLPVAICGMAGSRQGWAEARYVDVPARLEQTVANAVRIPGDARDIRILPGIAQRNASNPDVMRGEETQLLGALPPGGGGGLACMPGTHSKWVRLVDGQVTAFATFMTGELFEVLSTESILAHAIDAPHVDPGDAIFASAVAEAIARPAEVTNALFAIRPAQLLGFDARGHGAARLSGALIGAEIAGAMSRFGKFDEVALIASGSLAGLYTAALAAAGAAVRSIDAEEAVRAGLLRAALTFWPERAKE